MSSLVTLKNYGSLRALGIACLTSYSPVHRTTKPICTTIRHITNSQHSSTSSDVYVTTKMITSEIVESFAKLTNDSNPIHLENTCTTQAPIVHGALLMSLVAGVMGSEFPGPGSIVISQEMIFKEACPVNSNVRIHVSINSKDSNTDRAGKRRKITECIFSCNDENDPSICYMKGKAKLRIKS